jgi:hypothetical protein
MLLEQQLALKLRSATLSSPSPVRLYRRSDFNDTWNPNLQRTVPKDEHSSNQLTSTSIQGADAGSSQASSFDAKASQKSFHIISSDFIYATFQSLPQSEKVPQVQ